MSTIFLLVVSTSCLCSSSHSTFKLRLLWTIELFPAYLTSYLKSFRPTENWMYTRVSSWPLSSSQILFERSFLSLAAIYPFFILWLKSKIEIILSFFTSSTLIFQKWFILLPKLVPIFLPTEKLLFSATTVLTQYPIVSHLNNNKIFYRSPSTRFSFSQPIHDVTTGVDF